jgi:hypothetical protein
MFDLRLSPRTVIVALGIVFLLPIPLRAQQTYVTRFDAYGGYAFLNSPRIGLFENGFAAQFGIRPRTWYSFGLDYSFSQGDLAITPDLLPAGKQASLSALFGQLSAAHQLPPGYALVIPARSRTQTFAVGPQLAGDSGFAARQVNNSYRMASGGVTGQGAAAARFGIVGMAAYAHDLQAASSRRLAGSQCGKRQTESVAARQFHGDPPRPAWPACADAER